LKLEVKGLGPSDVAVISIQDATDGFVSTTLDQAVISVSGGEISGFYQPPAGHTWTQVDLPGLRVGQANARLRVNVLELSSGASVTVSLSISL
jgi:hypothetical protein